MDHDETLQLPAQTVDPQASLAERLTDNIRFQAGPARYFQRDENGEPVEDWGDVFERVAQNLAIPVAVHHELPVHVADADSPVWAEWVDVEADVPGEAPWEVCDATAPYLCYDGLIEVVPDEIAVEMRREAAEFEYLMRTQQWMPNTPTLMNAGTELQQLSACFVVEPADSMADDSDTQFDRSSIMSSATEAAEIFKSGGGVGYPFHHLRPNGAYVTSTGGISSGPLSFMQVFDTVCGTVKQGGRRRGAQMGIMHSQHPDIGRFCTAKRGEDSLTNFNISVGLVDEFMDAVRADESYTLIDPRDGFDDPEPFEVVPQTRHFYASEYEDCWNEQLDKPGADADGNAVEENFWRDYYDEMQDPSAFDEFRDRIDLTVGEPMELPARFIWRLIIDGSHNNGEPGFVSLSEINDQHSFDVDDYPSRRIHSTNPCAEQELVNYEACNLGHVNLSLVVDDDAPSWDEFEQRIDVSSLTMAERADRYVEEALDIHRLESVCRTGTRFLDNVVTMSKFPIDDITETVNSLRKIGLGVMGLHQLLLQLGVSYGSEAGRAIAEQVIRRQDLFATEESARLAEQRGPFPAYEESKWAHLDEYPEWAERHAHVSRTDICSSLPVRNHKQTTVAPTGTTSMISDTSGGIEPIYRVAFFKNVGDDIQGDDMLVEFDDYFLSVLEANDVDVDVVRDEIETKMYANEFDGVDGLETVPDAIADVFVTADQLSVADHIEMQAAVQRWIGSGVSKTLNCANDTTIDEVGDAIERATSLGIKGATVYRDGSRNEQVKTTRVDNNLDDQVDSPVDALQLFVDTLDADEPIALPSDTDDSDVEVTTDSDDPWLDMTITVDTNGGEN